MTADIPEVECVSTMLKRIDVEAKRWFDCVNILAIQPFQDGRFSSIVQTPVTKKKQSLVKTDTFCNSDHLKCKQSADWNIFNISTNF